MKQHKIIKDNSIYLLIYLFIHSFIYSKILVYLPFILQFWITKIPDAHSTMKYF